MVPLMSQNLHEHTFGLYHKEMHETTYKYKLPEHLSKAKLNWCPLSTIYYSNAFTFLLIYPLLLQYTYKVNLKLLTPRKCTQKLQEFTRALLIMLLTFSSFFHCIRHYILHISGQPINISHGETFTINGTTEIEALKTYCQKLAKCSSYCVLPQDCQGGQIPVFSNILVWHSWHVYYVVLFSIPS